MAHTKKINESGDLLTYFGDLSQKIIQNHYKENLSEFILHDICSDKAFNIRKAAYLVDNPDFSCLKGVAGHNYQEIFNLGDSWENQKDFTTHMQQAKFNQHVRTYFDDSWKNLLKPDISKKEMQKLIDYLEIEDPLYHVWNSKHNNKGLFIFEKSDYDISLHNHLLKFLQMLSFSPIF